MTSAALARGFRLDVAEPDLASKAPEPRVTPPLLMGDILTSRNGVPTFVTEWIRLEKERDARRAAKAQK